MRPAWAQRVSRVRRQKVRGSQGVGFFGLDVSGDFARIGKPPNCPGIALRLQGACYATACRALIVDGPTLRKMKLLAMHRRIPQIVMHTRDDCHTVVV